MRAPFLVIATCCVVLGILGGAWIAAVGGTEPSRAETDDARLIAGLPTGTPDRPLLVWLGDSTIVFFGQPTYPMLIANALAPRARVDVVVRAELGFTWYQYYCLMAPVLEAHPRLVVFVLNLRTLRTTPRSSATLCSRLSIRQLATAMTLPLADIGLPAPRLLVAQALRWGPLVRALEVFDAARERVDTARIALGIPPRSGVAGAVWRAERTMRGWADPVEAVEQNYLATWRAAVHERPATLRMIEATVRLATTRGARVLVVVSPVPVDVLIAAGAWDAAGYAALIERIYARVTRAGGDLLDLHDAVGTAGFRHGPGGFDRLSAHLNATGAAAVSDWLLPVVARELGVTDSAVAQSTSAAGN